MVPLDRTSDRYSIEVSFDRTLWREIDRASDPKTARALAQSYVEKDAGQLFFRVRDSITGTVFCVLNAYVTEETIP